MLFHVIVIINIFECQFNPETLRYMSLTYNYIWQWIQKFLISISSPKITSTFNDFIGVAITSLVKCHMQSMLLKAVKHKASYSI